ERRVITVVMLNEGVDRLLRWASSRRCLRRRFARLQRGFGDRLLSATYTHSEHRPHRNENETCLHSLQSIPPYVTLLIFARSGNGVPCRMLFPLSSAREQPAGAYIPSARSS